MATVARSVGSEASETTDGVPEDLNRNKRNVILVTQTKRHWSWSVARAMPLLLPLLAWNLIVTTGVPPRHRPGPETTLLAIPNSFDITNRQLLENGLRGGNNEGIGPVPVVPVPRARGNPSVGVSNTTIPLHAHSGSHHVHLYVGSPPQRQTLIVDTGSRAMAFPCVGAANEDTRCCGVHASTYFDPSRSTTHVVSECSRSRSTGSSSCLLEGISSCPLLGSSSSHEYHCTFSQKYTEGSAWTATEVEDLVWLGPDDALESLEKYMPALAVAYPFGCQTSSSGLFRKQYADGILGLSLHPTSLVTAFYHEGRIPANAFSLCFTPLGGVLSLGGTLDPQKYHYPPSAPQEQQQHKMKTTPVTKQHEHGYYSIEVVRLVVKSTSDNNNAKQNQNGTQVVVTDASTHPRLLRDVNGGKGCILDSGTTDSYFPASLARAVRRAVIDCARSGAGRTDDAIAGKEDSDLDLFSTRLRERAYTYEEFRKLLPVLTIVFANKLTLDIVPQHYMESVPLDPSSGRVIPWKGTRVLTNRLYFDEADGSVLGANALFGYDILFDGGGGVASSETQMRQQHREGGARVGIAPADCHAAARDAVVNVGSSVTTG